MNEKPIDNKEAKLKMVVTIKNVPRSLFLAFKAHCALRDISIEQGFRKVLREHLKKTQENP